MSPNAIRPTPVYANNDRTYLSQTQPITIPSNPAPPPYPPYTQNGLSPLQQSMNWPIDRKLDKYDTDVGLDKYPQPPCDYITCDLCEYNGPSYLFRRGN